MWAVTAEEVERGSEDVEEALLGLSENDHHPASLVEALLPDPAASRQLVELFGSQGWSSVIQPLRCPVDDPLCGRDPEPTGDSEPCCYEECFTRDPICIDPGETQYISIQLEDEVAECAIGWVYCPG